MKRTAFVTLAGLLAGTAVFPAAAADVKIGLLGGITGAIAAMAPPMIAAAKLAIAQVNDNGGVTGGKLVATVGDSGCNPQTATDAATKLVNIETVIAVVGPHCSGAVLAAANSVTIPAGVLMITPSGTSPEISKLADKDTVFRTVPSDDFQGRALARTLIGRGTKKVAVSYLNNDYGKGLAEAFKAEFEADGGTTAGYAAHEDGKASYRSDLAELAGKGADTLVIFDYGNGTGLTILRQALENGFFKNFVGGDGMKSDAVIKGIGAENLGTFLASSPVGEKGEALQKFDADFKAAGGDPNAIYATTSYDAAFLAALAIEKAGGDKGKLPASLREVTAGKGEAILPGEWAKAKQLIDAGKDVYYQGASGKLSFDQAGDVPGNYSLFKVGPAGSFDVVQDMK